MQLPLACHKLLLPLIILKAFATYWLYILFWLTSHYLSSPKELTIDYVFLMQAVTRVKPYICTMPLKLDEGWNQIQLNLADFTKRAYGTNYVETLRVQVHANCRLRRIYFSDRLYSEEELPPEFKLYLPMQVNWFNNPALAAYPYKPRSWTKYLYKFAETITHGWRRAEVQ